MLDAPLVSAVLLSYNRPEMLREVLASVTSQTYPNLRVVVVDNKSPASGEVRDVVEDFPEVGLIASPTNSGFTAGMNLGLRQAAGEYVLFTEDDIIVAPNAVGALVDYLESHPDIGLAGAVMLNRNSGTVRCAGGEVRIGRRLEFRVLGEHELPIDEDAAPYRVSYLPGAFILARRDLLDQVGGFWDELFMYKDDVELCIRVTRAGAGIAIVPAARVWHFDPPPCPSPGWLIDIKARNTLWVYIRHAPLRVLFPFVARYYLLGVIRGFMTDRRQALALARAIAVTIYRLPTLLALRSKHPPVMSRKQHPDSPPATPPDQRTILHLGSGLKYQPDAVNVDLMPITDPDIVHDLNILPWPLPDDRFKEVRAYDVIEHLVDVVAAMEEIHRICRDGAVVKITVPHYSCCNAFTDITHHHYFSVRSFDYFTGDNEFGFYSDRRFRKAGAQIVFFPSLVNKVVWRLARRFPAEYERRWAWMFPAWFLYFELIVVKPDPRS